MNFTVYVPIYIQNATTKEQAIATVMYAMGVCSREIREAGSNEDCQLVGVVPENINAKEWKPEEGTKA